MQKVHRWTTPEAAIAEEVAYWQRLTVSQRVAAVEALRRQTVGVYDDVSARLERVHRAAERSVGPCAHRGDGARAEHHSTQEARAQSSQSASWCDLMLRASYLPAALASALRYARTACITVGASKKETSAFRSMPGNCSLSSTS